MYLVSIIAGETYCVLNCDYCMYNKKIKSPFSDTEFLLIDKNIHKINKFINTEIPSTQVVSLTGGEPALFPNIIKKFYDIFNKQIIRICTNGILMDAIGLNQYSPDRIYFAISLDGITLDANYFRLKSQKLLDKIINTIDTLLNRGFSVEILTVLNPQNITRYIELLKYFEDKYSEYISNGQLRFIPFELVNYMNLQIFNITEEQVQKFVNQIKSNRFESLVISLYDTYFQKIISFYEGNVIQSCEMYHWGVYLKYLGDSLRKNGSFNVYGCGSRGHLMIGTMNFSTNYDYKFIMERRSTKSVENYFKEEACKKCFDNWHFYGMMLKGELKHCPTILKKTLSYI